MKKVAMLAGSIDAASKNGEKIATRAINKMDNLCRRNPYSLGQADRSSVPHRW